MKNLVEFFLIFLNKNQRIKKIQNIFQMNNENLKKSAIIFMTFSLNFWKSLIFLKFIWKIKKNFEENLKNQEKWKYWRIGKKITKNMKNDEFSTFDELVLEKKNFFSFFFHMLVMSIGLVHMGWELLPNWNSKRLYSIWIPVCCAECPELTHKV